MLGLNAWLRLIAGSFVVLSVSLGHLVSPWFYAFTAFVGLNLVQSALSGWCPMMSLLRRLGVRDEPSVAAS
jgi:hypothetical protein